MTPFDIAGVQMHVSATESNLERMGGRLYDVVGHATSFVVYER